jgi:BirA family biotin operon repressor/biotin-[acetyl-CoA-carboxylase] ligase
MPSSAQILAALSHREFRSGERLARQFRVTRAAVSNAVHRLLDRGLDIDRVPGRGYRLRYPIELLSIERVARELGGTATRFAKMEVFEHLDSTNGYLLGHAQDEIGAPRLCLAEHQSAGRGRRGRNWISPFGANLYLSLLYRLERAGDALSALSLVSGLAVAKALEAHGLSEFGLKWPNDIHWRERKLAGVLLEAVGETGGPVRVVIGVGINLWMTRLRNLPPVDQPWTDLSRALDGDAISRNRLAADVAGELLNAVERFEAEGFAPFADAWRQRDLARDRLVTIHTRDAPLEGVARGVDPSGRLLFERAGQISAFGSGEISLRLESR